MEDILIRSKQAVAYRTENGPDATGCLLLYFLLRHNRMLSIHNIKKSCYAVAKDPKSGWKQAVASIKAVFKHHMQLQRLPAIPKCHATAKDEEQMKKKEKFGMLCKSLVERMELQDNSYLVL